MSDPLMTAPAQTDAPRRATARDWIGLAVLALACLLYVMDLTVLHLAVPAISADLKPSSAQLLWIIDIYGSWSRGRSSRWGRWATGWGAESCS